MDKKSRAIRGLLNFLMPGLGHVYVGHYVRGFLFFSFFALLLAFSSFRLVVPVVCLLAALDVYRLAPSQREALDKNPTWRRFVYFSVGFVGFFGWFLLIGSESLTLGVQTRMQSRIDPLVRELKTYKTKHGSYPDSLLEMLTDRPADDSNGESLQSDPWGKPFDYKKDEDGFILRSAGKDGVFGTGDDFIYHFR